MNLESSFRLIALNDSSGRFSYASAASLLIALFFSREKSTQGRVTLAFDVAREFLNVRGKALTVARFHFSLLKF